MTNFNRETLERALERVLEDITDAKGGEFLKQQFQIQFVLFHLIMSRMADKQLCEIKWHKKNKELKKALKKETLGSLINFFTPISKEEKDLKDSLKNYNTKRNKLVHRQHEFSDLKEMEKELKEVLELGERIYRKLVVILLKDENFVKYFVKFSRRS